MKSKRVWLVLAGCMLLYGALMGVLFNCTGVLLTAVKDSEGFSSTDLSVFYTARSLVQAIAMLFTAILVNRMNTKWLIFCIGLVTSSSYMLMYFYHAPGQWLISGIMCGIGTSLASLLPTTVIKAWFVKKRGTFLGMSVMLSGIIGAFLNPLVSGFIESHGWRNGAVLLAVVSFVMTVMAALLIVRRPSDVGEIPYGGTAEDAAADVSAAGKKLTGAPLKFACYLYLFLSVSVAGLAIQMTSYIPQYASSLGYPLMVGATLTSAIMIGNVSAKFAFGVISDRIGVWRTVQILVALIATSFVILTFFGDRMVLIYIACVMLGFAYTNGVAMSLACVDVYDSDEFEVQYSRTSLFSSLITTFAPKAISYLFDTTGSFKTVFLIFASLMYCGSILIFFRYKFGIVKSTDKNEDG